MFNRINRKIYSLLNLLKKNFYSYLDYKEYAKNIKAYTNEIDKTVSIKDSKSLLIISGRGMNISWAQIWTFLSLAAFKKSYRVIVLTFKNSNLLNKYYSLMPIKKIYFEDFEKEVSADLSLELKNKINALISFEDYKNFNYNNTPIGQIALSTYSRYFGTGLIDIDKLSVRKLVNEWIVLLIRYSKISELIYDRYNVQSLFFTEVFLEEYGAFYYAAINNGLNVIRFAGTARDDSFVLQHLSKKNNRIHHSSISKENFKIIKSLEWSEKEETELKQNFMDRYGEKWHRAKRNKQNTIIMSPDEMRIKYNISNNKKVAIIYSHILYDTLFFFGTDLFSDYAEWLVESVKMACENDSVEWFIKVHPSNIWRGELNSLLKGKYEEEKLLESKIGKLPSHVRMIPADNDGINPYSWFEFADYGITVRGTSGLEIAALGKTVICAGTGRYEGNGFTVDPLNKDEYLNTLKNIQDISALTKEKQLLAKQYAHAIFIRKPFQLSSLKMQLKHGIKKVLASDDIIYIPLQKEKYSVSEIDILSDWLEKTERLDLLKGVDYVT